MKPNRFLGVALLAFAASGCADKKSVTWVPPTAKSSAPAAPVETSALPEAVPSIDLGPLDAPQPVYQEAQAAVPVSVAEPAYVPEPTYVLESPGYAEAVPLRQRGTMAPIYDDPAGGSARAPSRSGTYDITARKAAYRPSEALSAAAPPPLVRNAHTPDFGARLARAAQGRVNPNIRYVASYVKIGYPWGDVPENTGVCTDVVIRSYRALGVDLQKLVHEDMRQAFSAYPSQRIYGLRKADPNIDHRRVVNLEAFFERVGASVPVSSDPESYQPGDVVTWRLSGNEPHTGIVIAERDPRTGNPLIVHNLGAGVKKEDILFLSTPVGHYRFAPDEQVRMASLALKR